MKSGHEQACFKLYPKSPTVFNSCDFAVGETKKKVTVSIINDELDEDPEEFTVSLLDPDNLPGDTVAKIGEIDEATITILDPFDGKIFTQLNFMIELFNNVCGVRNQSVSKRIYTQSFKSHQCLFLQ